MPSSDWIKEADRAAHPAVRRPTRNRAAVAGFFAPCERSGGAKPSANRAAHHRACLTVCMIEESHRGADRSHTGRAPVRRVRPAMSRILTTRRGCQPAFSAMKALMTNESYLLCIRHQLTQYAEVERTYVNTLTIVCSELPTPAERIREGVRTRNGKIMWAGAEACARDLGRKRQWDNWARECSDLEYVSIAKVKMEIGEVVCDRYSQ